MISGHAGLASLPPMTAPKVFLEITRLGLEGFPQLLVVSDDTNALGNLKNLELVLLYIFSGYFKLPGAPACENRIRDNWKK